MTGYNSSPSELMNDYANLRTLPALLGLLFALASVYQFGGIETVYSPWIDYTLTAEHATFISLGSYAIAFASSETRELQNYRTWEKVLIGAGPPVVIAHQYWTPFADAIANAGTLGQVIAALLVMVSWGVVVR